MARVVIGLSGGVDSSVAAYLLQQAGHEVIGLFMINWHDTTGTLEGDCPWHDDRLFAELVARRLDIPFHTVDLSDQYRRRVVDYMFSEYAKGRTPNPDVLCNREIKFDVFLKEALKLGADFVATGHYCRKAEETAPDGRTIYKLLAGSDPNKDQSYFLCQLSQEQLSRALFPVGHLLKPEVRRIAEQMKLATAKRKDSQGICFVGKVDLPVFLQQKLKVKTGNVHEIKADWPKYGQAVPLVGKTEDAGMGTAERTASDKSATLRGINPANTDSTECPNPATAPSEWRTALRRLPSELSPGSDILSSPYSPDLYRVGWHFYPNPATAPTATAAKRSSTPTDTELAALAAPYRYTVRDGKKIGQHNGAHFYTIGQRKGLGIGGRKESLFVLATDVEQNVIYVGEGDNHPGLYRRALRIAPGELHWIDPLRELKTGESRRFDVRIRYRQPLQGAELFIRPDAAYLLFDEPQRGITPGQFAAWYDGDELVGSGVIAE